MNFVVTVSMGSGYSIVEQPGFYLGNGNQQYASRDSGKRKRYADDNNTPTPTPRKKQTAIPPPATLAYFLAHPHEQKFEDDSSQYSPRPTPNRPQVKVENDQSTPTPREKQFARPNPATLAYFLAHPHEQKLDDSSSQDRRRQTPKKPYVKKGPRRPAPLKKEPRGIEIKQEPPRMQTNIPYAPRATPNTWRSNKNPGRAATPDFDDEYVDDGQFLELDSFDYCLLCDGDEMCDVCEFDERAKRYGYGYY